MTRKLVQCPYCRLSFFVEDIHRPFRCPYCGALLACDPPDFRPRVILRPEDVLGGGN